MSRDEATLLDIRKAAQLCLEFVQGIDQRAFIADAKTQSAVLHQLLILGEAVKRLSEEFRRQHPAIPWRGIAGLRDKLIHEYDDVDLEGVWKTVSAEIPKLVATLDAVLPRDAKWRCRQEGTPRGNSAG